MAKLSRPPSLTLRWQQSIDDYVIALAWSPDNSLLAAASIAGPIVVFDAATGVIKQTLQGHALGTNSLSWQPKGHLLASSGQDGKIRIWEAASGRMAAVADAGANWVERALWNPKGDQLLSAAGKKVRLWNDRGELLCAYQDQPSTIADIQWNAKGKEFVSAGYGGIAFWQPDSDVPRARFEWNGSVLAVAWAPDGKYIAGGAEDASVHLWRCKDGKDLEMTGYPRKVAELSWDSEGRFLATGGGELVTIWDCSGKGPAGSKPLSLSLHEKPVSALAFQNRNPLLASSCSDGILALWLPGGSKKVLAQTKWDMGISRLSWSPNDSKIAIGGEQGAISVWSV